MTVSSPRLERVITQAWRRRGLLAWGLWPLSLVFGAIVRLRRYAYAKGWFHRWTAPVPVIVVGNIFVGGTGKTPLVIWLVQQLQSRGYTPGVISRGYGSRHHGAIDVGRQASPSEVGDEPLLIAQRTQAPVVVARDRVLASRTLLAAHPAIDLIIADDGLQHYALNRTIEIQLSDERGHGNGWLLPAGPLREPAARRSDFHVCHGGSVPAGGFAMRLAGDRAEPLMQREQARPLSSFRAQPRIAAAAGIGHPERFFTMLRAHGIDLCAALALPDHFDFSHHSFASVEADTILITEKDAVKCAAIAALARDPRLWVVPVDAVIDGPLADNLVEKLRGRTTA